MLEEIWTGFLELTGQFVIPDWGAVVALLPVLILLLVVVILANHFLRILRAPGARRGKTRITPRTPAGIHMPGPSFSPIFAAIGAFMLVLGLVFEGPILVLGAIGLGLTLLYWLAEALRTYDRDLGVSVPSLPVIAHGGPPAGVHMPGPSFRPVLGAIGMGMMMLGLVFGGWLLAAGVIALVATLLGWMVDARQEFVKTVEADTTGHLENVPRPRTPSALFWVLSVLLVGGVVLQAGWLPPRDVSEGGGATGSAVPSGSGGPGASPGGPEADVVIHAKNVAFLEPTITAPADAPFTLAFVNDDPGTPHNVEIKDGSGTSVYKGAIFPGVVTRIYDVPAIAAGSYAFVCTVHPTMTGTATLK